MNKILLTFLLLFNITAKANTNIALDKAIEELRVNHQIPALSIAIISKGEVAYTKGFGFIDANRQQPTLPTSLFRIASISKLFTAQAIMQLVEAKKLTLDDTIGDYLADFSQNDIKIKQLLTHGSGINDRIKPVNASMQRSEQNYLKQVASTLESKNSKQQFSYSDTGFNLLGAIVSKVSGLSFEDYIQRYIIQPAGLTSSYYFNGNELPKVDAQPSKDGHMLAIEQQRPFDQAFNPSEGMISNVNDLAQWLKLTLAQESKLLTKLSYLAMLEPQLKTNWGEVHIGLGWQVYQSDDGFIARHPGSIRGYSSLLLTYPEKQHAMIILTNSANAPRWNIAKEITKIMKQHKLW